MQRRQGGARHDPRQGRQTVDEPGAPTSPEHPKLRGAFLVVYGETDGDKPHCVAVVATDDVALLVDSGVDKCAVLSEAALDELGVGSVSVLRQVRFRGAKGKNDFVLFEPLDDAVRDGRRLVIVAPLGAGRGALASSQVYLASSFARWLREGKVDGAGRPFGEVKDEEPTLRKPFTRAQLEAILAFGDEAE